MKIFLIHGDDTYKSSLRLEKFISEARKRNWEISYVGESSEGLDQNLSKVSLYGNTRFFVVRDFKKLKKKNIEWLLTESDSSDSVLVLYSYSSVNKRVYSKLFKKIKAEEFKLPVLLWKFLDSFYPGNSRDVLEILHKIAKTEPVEFIFSFLAKLLHDLYWIKTSPNSLNYEPWRLQKLKNQADKFSHKLLEGLISSLAEADIKSKTSSENLLSLIDFIVIEKLELN